ncbi:hypothetical protein GOODEAATRI_011583 [Goodea atripinnis]|uniref:Uncharacterized protein n=1 Tax=Goodea atripinnis TaxID=208336 RepID=A0ABV0MIZ6_9TELE
MCDHLLPCLCPGMNIKDSSYLQKEFFSALWSDPKLHYDSHEICIMAEIMFLFRVVGFSFRDWIRILVISKWEEAQRTAAAPFHRTFIAAAYLDTLENYMLPTL